LHIEMGIHHMDNRHPSDSGDASKEQSAENPHLLRLNAQKEGRNQSMEDSSRTQETQELARKTEREVNVSLEKMNNALDVSGEIWTHYEEAELILSGAQERLQERVTIMLRDTEAEQQRLVGDVQTTAAPLWVAREQERVADSLLRAAGMVREGRQTVIDCLAKLEQFYQASKGGSFEYSPLDTWIEQARGIQEEGLAEAERRLEEALHQIQDAQRNVAEKEQDFTAAKERHWKQSNVYISENEAELLKLTLFPHLMYEIKTVREQYDQTMHSFSEVVRSAQDNLLVVIEAIREYEVAIGRYREAQEQLDRRKDQD
ncbi:MAG: hypothetical protein J2P36_05505, partial [Ktedonobacteraceae bacterium]|nr:hypothetical protein [Ktedonobacteraceae bacterium]